MLFIHFKTLFSFRFYHRLAQLRLLPVIGFVVYLFLLSTLVLFFFTGSFVKNNLPVFLKNFPRHIWKRSDLLMVLTLAWVHRNQLYMPSVSGLQTQDLPKNLNFTSDAQTIEKYTPALTVSLRVALFLTAVLLLLLFLVFDYCMALGVLFFFSALKRVLLPKTVLLKWAAFLLGPLSVLFFVHLWITVPLFTFAQLIVCIIYAQQIFNTLPEIPHEN